MQLLIERIDFIGGTGEMQIAFRDSGIDVLNWRSQQTQPCGDRQMNEGVTINCKFHLKRHGQQTKVREGEAYIKSQQHEGWVCLPGQYDDGGFTGANMDRPARRRLLADIEAGKVDCVVVYKVDRLSRSLLDFARIMETFERHQVSFVSVTQAFNTATSMGRLVLNVLLSFAQFEREMISERTRDKLAAARRKGKWSGGMPILGYTVEQTKLIVDQAEADLPAGVGSTPGRLTRATLVV